jgi:hypothetical protein
MSGEESIAGPLCFFRLRSVRQLRSPYEPNDQANNQEGAKYSVSKHCVSPVC